jgi:DNA-directed RNA polymerase specialized sigma24 family protein
VADAAAVLGMKPGTARVRLHRSRARIQSAMAPGRTSARVPITQEELS